MSATYRTYALPWDLAREDNDRLRAIAQKLFIVALVLTVLMTLMPVPEVDHDDMDRVPPRFARLMLDQPKPPPPPPIVQPQPERPIPEETGPEEPKLVEERKPEPTVEPPPEPRTVDKTEQARKKAAVAGLLPFADDLADLRDNRALASVRADRQLAGAAGEARRAERSMITSKAGRGSGGINTASMSRDTGGAGLASDVAKTAVSSTVAGMAAATQVDRPDAIDAAPARSREEIEMVFDQNKGAIFALYNRALRRDPTLQGKMLLRLTIEPSGVVSRCEVVSSEIADEELQRKLISRIKLFRFEAKDVSRITTTKPIDFFPA